MIKKSLMFLLGFIITLAGYSTAWSSVVGTWDIQGPMTAKITAKGQKTKIIRGTIDDIWTFHDNGTFESPDVAGTWIEPKKKFTVYPNPADISDVFSNMLSEELDTDITVEKVTKMTCSGTEQKNGALKGKLTIAMDIYAGEYGIRGKANITSNFVGTPGDILNPPTNTFTAPTKTIIIDGNYNDWNINDRVFIDTDGPECNNVAGRDIKEVYVAQDESFIYIRFILNGPFDPTYGYKFGADLHAYIGYGGTQFMRIFLTTPQVSYPQYPDSYLAASGNQFEARIPKSDVLLWKNENLAAWADQGSQTECRDYIELNKIDFGLQ
jgi:hypothetical protein